MYPEVSDRYTAKIQFTPSILLSIEHNLKM